MHLGEVKLMVGYFHSLGEERLRGMGVDPSKLPDAATWQALLEEDFSHTLDERSFFYTTWVLEGEPIGHCNVNKVVYGHEAFMHLHIWKPNLRRSGMGATAAKQSIKIFFETLRLRELYCEPFAHNEAPNRTLPKAGFQKIDTYETTPGWINFHQPVTRWRLRRDDVDVAPFVTLQTERLTLREFELEDAEVVYQLATDERINRFTCDDIVPSSVEETRRLIVDIYHRDYRRHRCGRLAMVERSSGRVIGFCGLKYLQDLGETDLGYRLLPEFWNRGLATEAARAVLKDGQQRLNIDAPVAFVLKPNLASRRVLEKLGWELTQQQQVFGQHVLGRQRTEAKKPGDGESVCVYRKRGAVASSDLDRDEA